MYDKFLELLNEKGCKTSDVAKSTGIHPSMFSDWKKGKSSPKTDKLMKIADFFGVQIECLTGDSEFKTKQDIQKAASLDNLPIIAKYSSQSTVGDRIKNIRIQSGLSQVDFADKIEISKQTLYKYENNIITNIPFEKIELIAKIGNISPSTIIGWDETDSKINNEVYTLGDIIKKYRADNNLSLDEFSKQCSLSKGYISMIENNINPRSNKPISPTLPSLEKISKAMNMELDELLKVMIYSNSLMQTDTISPNQKDFFIKVGQTIKRLREERGLTQEELAELLGYKSKSTINKVELGINDITRSKILEYATALGVSPSVILGTEHYDSSHEHINQNFHIQSCKSPGDNMLKSRRLEMRLTLEDVARIVGVSAATISRWESGDIANMGRDKIVGLAKALNVSPSSIMGLEEKDIVTNSNPLLNNNLASQPICSPAKELAKNLIDQIPESKMPYVIAYLQGAAIPDELPGIGTNTAKE